MHVGIHKTELHSNQTSVLFRKYIYIHIYRREHDNKFRNFCIFDDFELLATHIRSITQGHKDKDKLKEDLTSSRTKQMVNIYDKS